MDEFALYTFIACAIAFAGTLHYLAIWFEEWRLRRKYEKERREFHAAIDRGEKREIAPIYISRPGKASVECCDIVRTERFKKQLAAVERIRVAAEKSR